MKKALMATAILAVCILYACNNNKSKDINSGEQKDSALSSTFSDTAFIKPSESAYDSDPSDSIPGEAYGINSSSKQTANLVRLTLQDLHKEDLNKGIIDSFGRKFIFFEYDLNDDGKKEIFVGLRGSYFCGSGGCTQYLLDNQGNVITKFSVSRDIVIGNKKSNGYKDLFIYSGGKNRIVKFNGKTYPSNPSTLPILKEVPGDGLPRALNFINEPYPWFNF